MSWIECQKIRRGICPSCGRQPCTCWQAKDPRWLEKMERELLGLELDPMIAPAVAAEITRTVAELEDPRPRD